MSTPRMVVLMNSKGGAPGEAVPLGRRAEIVDSLGRFNTHSDGSGKAVAFGTDRLYGPGFVVEMPTGQDELAQVMVSIGDADTAWPVLSRMCKTLGWRMVDPDSGRSFF
ncbi:MAG: hypothetical protein KJZ54_00230 [Phycisphaerales bacterium]|nr:hypothetical protein [Phycisphaerales bacterium]